MPDERVEYKIKDKLDDKNRQFDDGDMSYVVLDITSVIIEKEKIVDMVKRYFYYTKNVKLWGVVIMIQHNTY